MFKESPFSGACEYATYEVLVMLIGTLLLGLLLGYLIWGWIRRHLTIVKKLADQYRRIGDLRQVQIVDLNTRIATVEAQLERAETRVSVAEYKLRRTHEEMESLKDQLTPVEQRIQPEESLGQPDVQKNFQVRQDATDTHITTPDEPTLADISKAMERGSLSSTHSESADEHLGLSMSVSPAREISPESLEMAHKIFDRSVEADDLQIIYGIDQRMEELLYRAGIKSWLDLAYTTLPDLRRIVEEAGPRYREHDPKTWSIQARMAAREEWKKLKAYQDALRENRD